MLLEESFSKGRFTQPLSGSRGYSIPLLDVGDGGLQLGNDAFEFSLLGVVQVV